MEIHHLALSSVQPESLAIFYTDVLGLEKLKVHLDENRKVRSVWLRMGQGILMLEKRTVTGTSIETEYFEKNESYYFLAFKIRKDEKESWKARLRLKNVQLKQESDYTLYFHDPEGHRIGLSCY